MSKVHKVHKFHRSRAGWRIRRDEIRDGIKPGGDTRREIPPVTLVKLECLERIDKMLAKPMPIKDMLLIAAMFACLITWAWGAVRPGDFETVMGAEVMEIQPRLQPQGI